MKKYSFHLGIFVVCLVILFGCGKLERKGTAPENIPPKVYFANIPPEGTDFSVNPEVHWYGTDIDGFVTAYQYAVMPKDSVFAHWDSLGQLKSYLHDIPSDSTSWVDQTILMNMLSAHVAAEPGGHTRKVMMFAHMDPDTSTPQYIFLRAVDNRGAVSEVKHLMLSRHNHRPRAFIDMDSATFANFVAKGHYCLEETTATWKGISIPWVGWDSLDYPNPRVQPEFQFKWELVGPFEDSLESAVSPGTTAVVDSSLDSILIVGKWVYTRWVSERMHVFKNLKNYGEDIGADAGYGWYQLRVRARDDALVSHDTAAIINFRIIKPRFRYTDRGKKTILVVDHTSYGGKAGGVPDTQLVRPFYREALDLLTQDGLCDQFDLWYDITSDLQSTDKKPPEEDMLSQYDLVILLNLGASAAITEESFKKYKEYLNIGGRLWLIGMNNFKLPDTERKYRDFAEIRGSSPNTFDVATEYCGLEGMFIPYLTLMDTMTLEFTQAKPFGLWADLPTLDQDPNKCKELIRYTDTLSVRNFGVRGIPYVCYSAMSNTPDYADKIPYQRRIYSFVSFFGWLSEMHDKPCAENYIGPTFRTAEFSFPLNLMKNDPPDYPVFEVIRRMVEWFWEDLP